MTPEKFWALIDLLGLFPWFWTNREVVGRVVTAEGPVHYGDVVARARRVAEQAAGGVAGDCIVVRDDSPV